MWVWPTHTNLHARFYVYAKLLKVIVMTCYECGSYSIQSQNQILSAAASGDVASLRCIARETDPVLIAAVQNKVCCILHWTSHIACTYLVYMMNGLVFFSQCGWTAVHFAAYNGHLEMLQELLERFNCDADKRDTRVGFVGDKPSLLPAILHAHAIPHNVAHACTVTVKQHKYQCRYCSLLRSSSGPHCMLPHVLVTWRLCCIWLKREGVILQFWLWFVGWHCYGLCIRALLSVR